MILQRSIDKCCLPLTQHLLDTSLFSLDSETICAKVRQKTGIHDFADPQIEKRLAVLTSSLQTEADLHLPGRFLARMHLQGLLENRLRLIQIWKQLPDLPGEQIQRPIFITGLPRSGSTFLHALFMQNGSNRAPLVWEVMFPPVSSRSDARVVNRQIRRATRCLWFFRQIAPAASAAHPITAMSPHECIAIHGATVLSQEFTITFNVPSYANYLRGADFSPAYAWQKQMLQFLQFRRERKQWILKAPDHVFSLPSLFEVFPDAIIIQMHRNPFDVLRSSLNLIGELRRVFARPQSMEEIARREASQLAEGLEQIARFRDSHPELASRFLDVHYKRLISDPINTVRCLHLELGLPWDSARAAQVEAFASRQSRYERPKRHFALNINDVSFAAAARGFARYCTQFGISELAATK